MYRSLFHALIAVALTAVFADRLPAEDVYFVKAVRDLEITEGKLPKNLDTPNYNWRYRQIWQDMQPRAVLDGPGEIYVAPSVRRPSTPDDPAPAPRALIAVRTQKGKDVVGRIFLVKQDGSEMQTLKFKIAAGEARSENKTGFLRTKQTHYQNLLQRDVAGAAWFRHQHREVARQLGQSKTVVDNRHRRFFGTRRANDMENTFALFSGGRAVSENLQLHRALPRAKPDDATVKLNSIKGITVREFNWQPLIKDAQAKTDPLAELIPDDQHALFFPSFAAVTELIDHAQQQGTPILRLAEPRAENALTQERYQRQLCLPLGEVERLLGPQLISSVAVTGGDPYFRTGTDVAVLFEAKNTAALLSLIQARVELARNANPEARRIKGAVRRVKYTGARSEGREICTYVAQLGGAVVVSNSLAQLTRLVEVYQGERSALAGLPEYTFFRTRYPLGEQTETGLLIISDKTIRRWCNPLWRIATSRRTRAAAVISELQADRLDQLVSGDVRTSAVQPGHWLPEAGSFSMSPAGVTTSTYGGLDFQTPIMELDVEYATAEEARFYARWRNGYQSNWSNFFDPIAVRFHASHDRLAADMTVMPLIDNSDYTSFVNISKGARIGPADADPHKQSLVHWALALNMESPLLKQYAGFASAFAPHIKVNPLSWIGNAVAIYTDEDKFWTEFAKVKDERKAEQFMERNWHRLPVALQVEVRSGLKLTAFLAGARAFIEQSAPGMTVWETKKHNDWPYVKVSPSAQAKSDEELLEELAVYYAASGDALILTLNEQLLKRAIDRQTARRTAKKDGKEPQKTAPDWIGDNMCFQFDRRILDVFQPLFAENYRHMMQARAWGNLLILNEWKRRYPNQDPVKVHEKFWHRRLVCPGGGEYRWNAEWQTMESTLYGHPGKPKPGPALPAALRNVQLGNFGITFEENGLRARVELRRKPRG
jgi:hypothetical protein